MFLNPLFDRQPKINFICTGILQVRNDFGSANVLKADFVAKNGVFHVIDDILSGENLAKKKELLKDDMDRQVEENET